MAVTKFTTEQVGTQTQYTVPFEVIAAADIDVYIEGVLQLQQNTTSTAAADHPQVVTGEITQGTALINYTVASNNGSITFNAAPTVGDFIVIERTTDDTLLETFVPGSTIRAQDLNSALERVLFIAQEGVNIANEALVPSDDEEDSLDAKGDRITNVGNAEDDNDAVNRGQLGKVITDDLIEGEGIDLTDVSGGTNSGKQVTISAELSTASNPGVVQVNATTPITATYSNPGELELSIADNSIDLDKIKDEDIITDAEQTADYDLTGDDDSVFTSLAAARRFDNYVQNSAPSGTGIGKGRVWVDVDDDLTLSVWNGSAWVGITSGGTFTNQPKVVYVDATSGDDANDGHRVSRPKQKIKAAIEQINNDSTYGDGSVVVVAPGVYQEEAPIQIDKKNVSIIGQALRSCIVHPTVATQEATLFELNSGSYVANLTLTGMKAGTGTGNTVDATLPTDQGWNFAFRSGATITKSPYIQNCTNFSDSEIDNSNLNAETPAGGLAGDTDSAPTGGGLLVDGSVVSSSSPLRSMVCDSYTHVGLNGPGILVTNNGYVQATSSYAFFNKYHIKCLNGGQANLAASTTDFGDQALVADGKSTTAIFTAALSTGASDGDITFTIGAPTADASWHGSATRPASNMLVELNSIIYPILSATANGSGWDVTISRPNPNNRSENLGLNGAVATPATASFYLRSMIASSGHTMEYVGSGTDYRALPENGGVPDETKQITESNNGKIWTAITDHNGKFKIGGNQTDDPIFEVDQQLGFITIPTGSIAFDLLSDATPQLGGDLDVNGSTITGLPTTPTASSEATSKAYVDAQVGAVATDVVSDTTPQLGGDLDVNGNAIVSVSNGNIDILPNGSGVVRVSDSGIGVSGGANADLILTPNGTGAVQIAGQGIQSRIADSDLIVQGRGTGNVNVNSSRITNVTDPTGAQDAATKNYVDEKAFLAASDTRIDLTDTGANGSIRFTTDNTVAAEFDENGIRLLDETFASDFNLRANGSQGTLTFREDQANGDHGLTFQAPSNVTADVTFTLPDGDGTAGYALTTNGSGTLSWAEAGTAYPERGVSGTNRWAVVHSYTVDADYSIPSGSHVINAGPMTVNSGVTVTIPTGSNWTIV